jgi:hypothetical protein
VKVVAIPLVLPLLPLLHQQLASLLTLVLPPLLLQQHQKLPPLLQQHQKLPPLLQQHQKLPPLLLQTKTGYDNLLRIAILSASQSHK